MTNSVDALVVLDYSRRRFYESFPFDGIVIFAGEMHNGYRYRNVWVVPHSIGYAHERYDTAEKWFAEHILSRTLPDSKVIRL